MSKPVVEYEGIETIHYQEFIFIKYTLHNGVVVSIHTFGALDHRWIIFTGEPMDNDTLLVIGFIGATILIFDTIFLVVIFNTRRKMNAVRTWPSAIGTVNASYLERRRSSNNKGSINYPVVQYSYQVGGWMYEGSRIAPGPEAGGTGAGRVIERYPAGAQVRVFYDPQNPSDAVLETKAPAQWIMWLVLVIINVMLCGMAGLFAFTL